MTQYLSKFYNNYDNILLTTHFDFSNDNVAFISWVKIKNILFNLVNLPFAICKLFQTNYFDEQYQSFNVTPKAKYICIFLKQFYQRSHEVHRSVEQQGKSILSNCPEKEKTPSQFYLSIINIINTNNIFNNKLTVNCITIDVLLEHIW
ncbi:Uncharacterized protein FWK35_00013167 [Aphis craccivora]|uniref:Uncharacterized protein n=1 Tax=Aphis craccivora TaxID=307492 RepID=A0A6G0Y7U0_APHCR|nr:Uncharacterized protein FWK35_00013167 [Aphis craccivora]